VTTPSYYDTRASSTRGILQVKAVGALGGASALSASAYGFRTLAAATTAYTVANDYDGDRLSDLVMFEPAAGKFRIVCSMSGQTEYGIQ